MSARVLEADCIEAMRAAVLEGFDFLGIEREPDYAAIARARIEFWSEYEGQDVEAVLAADARARKQRESGQETLL